MEKQIKNLLKKCGVPAHIIGYEYLADAVSMSKDDKNYYLNITKCLYPTLAKKYHKSIGSIERAIRHAIEIACSNLTPDLKGELFGSTLCNDKATNAHFIGTITELLD